MQTDKPMMKQYKQIKSQYSDCILMFRLGNFYEMFFGDAKIVSDILGLKIIAKQCGNKVSVPMCGIPVAAVDKHAEMLSEKGYKVAICNQVNGESKIKGVMNREVTEIILPTADGTRDRIAQEPDQISECIAISKKDNAEKGEIVFSPELTLADCTLVKELGEINLDSMTPLQALQLLHQWKVKYGYSA